MKARFRLRSPRKQKLRLVYLVLGGALGTISRFFLSKFIQERMGATFPCGTLLVNILGCFVIGILAASGQGQLKLSPEIRFILMAGFCGAFTTFSAFVFETAELAKGGQMLAAFGNVSVSLLAGFAAFFAGGLLGNKI